MIEFDFRHFSLKFWDPKIEIARPNLCFFTEIYVFVKLYRIRVEILNRAAIFSILVL